MQLWLRAAQLAWIVSDAAVEIVVEFVRLSLSIYKIF